MVRLRPVWMTNHPPSVLWHCWLGHQTCKNRRPYNLYCVGAGVKLCSINQAGRERLPKNWPQGTLDWIRIGENIQWHPKSSHLAIASSWTLPGNPPLLLVVPSCRQCFIYRKKDIMACILGVHGHPRRRHTKPNQPQPWLTSSHAASRALDCTDVQQELWLTLSERNKNGHVHT